MSTNIPVSGGLSNIVQASGGLSNIVPASGGLSIVPVAEDFCGILCIVSSDKDVIIISPTSCVNCTEKKLHLTVYDVFPLKRQDCNEWRKYGANLYNVKCECGSSHLNKTWNHRLKGNTST